MKTKHLTILCTLLILFVAMGTLKAQEYNHPQATAHATARIVSAFSAVKSPLMNLGTYSTQYYGGKLLPHSNGTLIVNDNIETGCKIDYVASFYVAGDRETAFSVSLPKATISLSNLSNTKTILVSNWKTSFFDNYEKGLLNAGYKKVSIGATLDVGTAKDNPVGTYTGVYIVTFDFN